ncbi:MAG: DUF373 family protein [Nitrosopumilus sp.]|nr:DUF373 family protein [Nitrosopumilus sp.]CAI9832112.1 conserved membrane hypothetical protein [Nitrosopumilaceae archaeon]MDA7941390.1 DUF373 family protein [Nitrosopumilus sp.]MDA7942798.1 DUF373 family protein [Nitrosopumilus sp.]MDA7945084.1 DUF373 family protein [Nitrosopumilus sp.]
MAQGAVEKDVGSSSASRLLVICIDRDDDVGEKAGIPTPVVGRDACIEAAQRLALEDPEDADSNSIFSAVKTYEDLVSRGYEAEVATVAGSGARGVQADEKILAEARSVLGRFDADGVVIVSDGEDDESVIPVIQNVVPVVSVQRVVMKVSRSVEYSYAVFGKYLKMVAYDPRYSKFFLGVPGMLLLIGGFASIFGFTKEITAVLVSVLGGAFIVRAFDIDKAWAGWSKPTPAGFVRTFTMVAGAVVIVASVPAGIAAAGPGADITAALSDGPTLGSMMEGALPVLWTGMGVVLAGVLLGNWLGGSQVQAIDALRMIVLAALYPIVFQFAGVLLNGQSAFSLVPPLLGGLAATLVAAAILFRYTRRRQGQQASGQG